MIYEKITTEKYKNIIYEKMGKDEIDIIYENVDDDYLFFVGDRINYFGLFSIHEKYALNELFYCKNIDKIKTYIFILEKLRLYCENIRKVIIYDEEQIEIGGNSYNLKYHYFFKYGMGYYEKHFGFHSSPYSKTELSKRCNMKLSKELIINIFLFYSGVFSEYELDENEKKKLKFFMDRFDENIVIFLSRIQPRKCARFYFYLLERLFKIYNFKSLSNRYFLDVMGK